MARHARKTSDPTPPTGSTSEGDPPPEGASTSSTPTQRARLHWLRHHDTVEQPAVETPPRAWMSLAFVAIATIASITFFAIGFRETEGDVRLASAPRAFGVGAAWLFVALVLLGLHLAFRDQGGFLALVDSKTGPAPTAPAVMATWVLLLAATFVFLLVVLAGQSSVNSSDMPSGLKRVDSAYILILGSLALAVVVRTVLVHSPMAPLDLFDVQLVAANLVGMVWFVGSMVTQRFELPVLPLTIVAIIVIANLMQPLALVAGAWRDARAMRRADRD